MPIFSRVTALKAATVASLGLFVMLVRSTGALQGAPEAASETANAQPATTLAASATPTPSSEPVPTPVPTRTPTPAPASGYRDGTYTATSSYRTPGGTQSIRVTLVISGGTIVDSTVTGLASGKTSQAFQQDFIANYQPFVTGRKLDQLNLTKVSSSSLTPNGFNRAVANIQGQAS
jgi:uncharacterized protein with FMN-binding domain